MLLLNLIDGSWIDISSFSGGVMYAGIRWHRNDDQKLVCQDTGLDILNGIALFPLLLLAVSTFSSGALSALLESNRIMLSASGIVALCAVLEDF